MILMAIQQFRSRRKASRALIPQPRPSLDALPNELLTLIFEYLTIADATCPGLTCPLMWGIFKKLHSKEFPISLLAKCCSCRQGTGLIRQQICPHGGGYLFERLKTSSLFKGHRAVIIGTNLVRFLNINVYGSEQDTPQQLCLKQRYEDHEKKRMLPRPYNRGEEWYTEAIEIINNACEIGKNCMSGYDFGAAAMSSSRALKVSVLTMPEKRDPRNKWQIWTWITFGSGVS